jgi:hypothetical protein
MVLTSEMGEALAFAEGIDFRCLVFVFVVAPAAAFVVLVAFVVAFVVLGVAFAASFFVTACLAAAALDVTVAVAVAVAVAAVVFRDGSVGFGGDGAVKDVPSSSAALEVLFFAVLALLAYPALPSFSENIGTLPISLRFSRSACLVC